MTTPTELRSSLIRLSDNAEADLAALWAQLDAATVSDAVFEVMPALVADYGDAAATLTAEWYEAYRAAINVAGAYSASLTTIDLGANALAGWAVDLARINWDTALAQVSGGLVKRVMTSSRQTVLDNTDQDPQAAGWMRVGRPQCGWCAMLISRGDVYRSRETADFAAHDNCRCACSPAWDQSQITSVRREFVPTARRRSEKATEADRARAKAWIAKNLPVTS